MVLRGKHRDEEVADAWRAMAEALDGVTAATNKSAQSVIGGNSGPAIDAFHTFWNRYYNGGAGALPDTAKACRQLASACDQFADEIDKAIHKLEEEAAIAGAALIGGTVLAFFTAGLSEAAAGAATAGIVAAADAIGVTVSETVASIAATALTGVAFGAVEATAVDGLIAQPVRIAFGDGGFSGKELLTSAETGGVMGGFAGGFGAGARALSNAAESADGASTALNAIGKISNGLDTMPGRMAVGAGMGAGQDLLFNGGHINPLDVVLGGVGGGAAPGRGKPHVADDGGDYLPHTAGSEFIDGAESESAALAYERIRNTLGDSERIAANTGIKLDVLARIKDHIFNTTHTDVPTPPNGELKTGRFAPVDHIADLWQKADAGTLTPEEATRFHRWAAHEGVESTLMAQGMPYRSTNPDTWDDGVNFPTRDDWGAHDVAPHETHSDPFVAWPRRGMEKPDFPIADDLSNLDDIVALIHARMGQ